MVNLPKYSKSPTPPKSPICGDFWITVDPYQGLNDTHYLASGFMKQVHWKGSLVDSNHLEEGVKLKKFVKLDECFRMPLNMIKHIKTAKVLPTNDLPRAKDVQSRGVVVEDIKLPTGGCKLQSLAEELADQLYKKVMITGTHPGHCAVVYNDGAMDDLFPPNEGGSLTFVDAVNSSLKKISIKGQASHMLQVTPDIKESLLYNESCGNTLFALPLPLTVSPHSISLSSAEETVEYKIERHCEVMLKMLMLAKFFLFRT